MKPAVRNLCVCLLVGWVLLQPLAARASYRLEFTHTLDRNDTEEMTLISRVCEGLKQLIETWSWARTYLVGTWRIRFVQANELQGLSPDAEAALGQDADNVTVIYLAWDRIRNRTEWPTIAALQSVSGLLYRFSLLGPDRPESLTMLNQIQAEGVYLALTDFRGTPLYEMMPKEARDKVQWSLRAYRKLAHEGLSAEQLQRLDCLAMMTGKPQ